MLQSAFKGDYLRPEAARGKEVGTNATSPAPGVPLVGARVPFIGELTTRLMQQYIFMITQRTCIHTSSKCSGGTQVDDASTHVMADKAQATICTWNQA
jgi:hypothetical protein